MIIGDGLLARAFHPYFGSRQDVVIFASGVSNSQETDNSAFDREHLMLRTTRDAHAGVFVYFGSCSTQDNDRKNTPYARHKAAMESLVLSRPGGLVLSLPQVVGRTDNPHTLTNFLYTKITRGEEIVVWSNAERNLIDIDDVATIGSRIANQMAPESSRQLPIASRSSILMGDLIAIFERILGRKANTRSEPLGASLQIDASEADSAARELGIDLGKGYVERVLRKYYANLT